MYKLGRFELHVISDGFFSLDGGAMFGIVPKVIWERLIKPDELNRVDLSLNCLLVQTGKRNILIETGVGEKYNPKWMEMYKMQRTWTVPKSLKAIGLGVEDIDAVVLSHLHFDHAGGCTVRNTQGRAVPTFPKAQYIIQEEAWEEATHTDERTQGSYIPDDFMPLLDAKKVKFVRGDAEVDNGIRVKVTGGHTKAHQAVVIESEGQKAIFWGCVMPTTNHIKPAYVMAYDLFPQEVVRARKELTTQAVAERWLSVWIHDPKIAMGFIHKGEKGYTVEKVEGVRG